MTHLFTQKVINLTTQSSAITATTIYTPLTSRTFNIYFTLQVTRVATTSSILGGTTGITITYTEPDGSVAQSIKPLLTSQLGAVIVPATGNTTNTTVTQSQGMCTINAKTGVPIQYAVGYSSTGGTTMQYSLHIRLQEV
jgi:hypothetical protein